MRELREDTFLGNKNDDAYEHVERILDIGNGWTDYCQEQSTPGICLKGPSFKASTNKLDSLGRDMEKLKENVHAIQVGCENYGGAHLNKECPPGYYTCVDNRLPFGEKKPSLEELMNKHLEESTRRRAKTEY
ncbi:hypothetical protein Tco_0831050 [Tanacetum coccineum]